MAFPFSDVSAFRRDPIDLFMQRAGQSSDGLTPLYLSLSRVFLATEPETARRILKADASVVDKGKLVAKLKAVVGDSLLTKVGEPHRRSKSVIHRHLQRNAIAGHLAKMAAIVNAHIATILTEGSCDTRSNASLALQLTCTAVFGSEVLNAADRHALIHSVQTMEGHLHDDMFRILPRMGRARRQSAQELAQAWEVFNVVIARAREHEGRSPLIRALETSGLSDQEICEELFGLMITGHHTTESAMSWIMYHLAADTAIAEVIAAEADVIMDDLEEGEASAFSRAPLSLTFVKEVLRLYPSGYWMTREVQSDFDVDGHRLRRGDTVVISPYQLHRDPRLWDRPETLELDRDFTNPAYLPFGVGSRACIGMALAWFQLQLVVLQLSSALRFIRADGEDAAPAPIPSVTLHAPYMKFDIAMRSDRPFTTELAA